MDQSLQIPSDSPGDLDDVQATFMRNVQHELRTPLALVLGYAELLQQGELGDLTPEQQRAVFLIADRAQGLYCLVERIITLTAVRSQSSARLSLALDDLVAKVMAAHQTDAAQAGLSLEVCPTPDLPLAAGDPYQLQQAIDCLLDNAIKFTPPGGRVQVRTYLQDDQVCLDVIDTGIGLTEKDREHIFAPFWQLDDSTSRRYEGLGLGLTVAKEVVEGHGGQIIVESQPGQGSRFTIQLPTISREENKRESMRKLTRQHILIVDDEETTRLLFQVSLEKLPNCDVTTAANSTEALALLAQRSFDLLITDYRMPDTDGMSLATQVRRLYPRTAIVMITAYSDDRLHKDAAQISIQRILDKPVAIDEIREVALEALRQAEDDPVAISR